MGNIKDFLLQFKNQTIEENEIIKHKDIIKEFAQNIRKKDDLKEYYDVFLTTLGYSYRLENAAQRLYYTFGEAVTAMDIANLTKDEKLLEINEYIYSLILDICIDEFLQNNIDEEEKNNAISSYKKLEAQKSKENSKYHTYQY
ncbi:MAG: hypothetical protein KAJ49_10930 [Arcobacteraceae bacterium]|nr:hypothetical protein [Arcobacteraceae bacterium]